MINIGVGVLIGDDVSVAAASQIIVNQTERPGSSIQATNGLGKLSTSLLSWLVLKAFRSRQTSQHNFDCIECLNVAELTLLDSYVLFMRLVSIVAECRYNEALIIKSE